jgi:hypothetical protein
VLCVINLWYIIFVTQVKWQAYKVIIAHQILARFHTENKRRGKFIANIVLSYFYFKFYLMVYVHDDVVQSGPASRKRNELNFCYFAGSLSLSLSQTLRLMLVCYIFLYYHFVWVHYQIERDGKFQEWETDRDRNKTL